MKKNILGKLLLTFCLFFGISSAIELDKIQPTMQTNINKTLAMLQELSPQNSKEVQEVAEKIFILFDSLFDYELMARLSLSQAYKTLNQEQIQSYNTIFEQNLKRSFTDKLKLYKDEKMEVLGGEQTKNNRYNLKTSLLINGELNYVVFKFYTNDNKDWKIYDVDILGISVIQTYRSQISDILNNHNFPTLLHKLQNEISFEVE